MDLIFIFSVLVVLNVCDVFLYVNFLVIEDLNFLNFNNIEFKILLIKFVVIIKSMVIVFVLFSLCDILIFIVVVIDWGNNVIMMFLE